MSEVIVKVSNLVKRYKELIALDNFSLEIKKGEVFGLLGPNGSGKSTTMNCVLSLLSYDKGEIEVFGEKMAHDRYDLKARIGVVPQNVAVYDELSVIENIDYFCGLYVKDKETIKKYVEDAISFVGLDDFKKFKPKKLPLKSLYAFSLFYCKAICNLLRFYASKVLSIHLQFHKVESVKDLKRFLLLYGRL